MNTEQAHDTSTNISSFSEGGLHMFQTLSNPKMVSEYRKPYTHSQFENMNLPQATIEEVEYDREAANSGSSVISALDEESERGSQHADSLSTEQPVDYDGETDEGSSNSLNSNRSRAHRRARSSQSSRSTGSNRSVGKHSRISSRRSGGGRSNVSLRSPISRLRDTDTGQRRPPSTDPRPHANPNISTYQSEHPSPMGEPVTRATRNEDEADVKRQLLVDIDTARAKGAQLRRFTMHDDRADMEFELRKIEMESSERETVGMMRDGLKLALTGVEFANTKLSLLDLEGWSAEVTRDMDKYNNALSRLYRKYCKRGTSRPEMELALAIMSSMIMFHVRRKFIGRGVGAGLVGAAMGAGAKSLPKAHPHIRPSDGDPSSGSIDDGISTDSSDVEDGPPPF